MTKYDIGAAGTGPYYANYKIHYLRFSHDIGKTLFNNFGIFIGLDSGHLIKSKLNWYVITMDEIDRKEDMSGTFPYFDLMFSIGAHKDFTIFNHNYSIEIKVLKGITEYKGKKFIHKGPVRFKNYSLQSNINMKL